MYTEDWSLSHALGGDFAVCGSVKCSLWALLHILLDDYKLIMLLSFTLITFFHICISVIISFVDH